VKIAFEFSRKYSVTLGSSGPKILVLLVVDSLIVGERLVAERQEDYQQGLSTLTVA